MKPIPVAFHIGPLEVHTYGIGLALTFWFAYVYFERRLKQRGFRVDWLPSVFIWIIITAVVGARALHVLSNLSFYRANPGDIFAIWHGGLSSFGGLLLAVPTALVLTHRRCPELGMLRGLDIVAPVLMAAWAMGRLLGPQLMVAGGGHPTTQWFGMYYAGQAGRRLPVPSSRPWRTSSSTSCSSPRAPDRTLARRARPERVPARGGARGRHGAVGHRTVLGRAPLARRGRPSRLAPGQVAGIALAVGGVVLLVIVARRWRAWRGAGAPGGHPDVAPPDGAEAAQPVSAVDPAGDPAGVGGVDD